MSSLFFLLKLIYFLIIILHVKGAPCAHKHRLSPGEPEEGNPTIVTGDADCSCGRSRLTGRIVGGELAKINELPWTVALVAKSFGSVFCGGTLICDRYVITAAHCFDGLEDTQLIEIYLMEEDFEKDDENNQPTLKIDVAEIIVHSQWKQGELNNDITLLKLATPVNISVDGEHNMPPVCLPADNKDSFAGIDAIVAGWGATKYGSPVVTKLRKVTVPIITYEECKEKITYKGMITEKMICAGYVEGQKDACKGDSGGPLVVENQGKYTLAGLVSFGRKCAEPEAPGVYTRIGSYVDWIIQNTEDCQYCNR